jgi:hypothetical protein
LSRYLGTQYRPTNNNNNNNNNNTQRQIPEEDILHSHCRENLKYYILETICFTIYPRFNGLTGGKVSDIAECPYCSQTRVTEIPILILQSILTFVLHSSLSFSSFCGRGVLINKSFVTLDKPDTAQHKFNLR